MKKIELIMVCNMKHILNLLAKWQEQKILVNHKRKRLQNPQ